MKTKDIPEKLRQLKEQTDLAFKESNPNVVLLSQIVNDLRAIHPKFRLRFSEFANTLRERIFKSGATIKGLDTDLFLEEVNEAKKGPDIKYEAKFSEVKTNLEELLKSISRNLFDHFEILKGYFILKLENNPLEDYRLMVLYDTTIFIQPIKKKISKVFTNPVLKTIEEYNGDIEKGNLADGNFLCLLLLHPRTNDEEKMRTLKQFLRTIIGSYKSFENYSLKLNSGNNSTFYESSNSKEDFLEEVEFVNGTLLSNGLLKHEEERMIKKLCSSFRTPLIIYRTLKGGNSGSKVIEVRPKKELGPDHEKRFIVKYGEKNDERKIYKEYECFGKFIDGYKGFKDYECKYDKTLILEGLRYSYAISDLETNSFSYHEILTNGNNKFHLKKVDIINELFDIDLYKLWQDSNELIHCSTSDLYENYVNPEQIFLSIRQILDLNEQELSTNELYVNFNKIWNAEYDFNKKICHGDLHTENFFKDNEGIYLIDFGYTGERHAIIDHTSLECSIKFKHLPFYLGSDELIKIEEELALPSSFQLSQRFASTKRINVLETLDIVKRIRINSQHLLVNNTSVNEYLISLFIMTFRQIRYKDMNQLYAYHSALILSRQIR